MGLSDGPPEPPVTVLVSRVVKPGYEAAFEAWADGISQEALHFPGHRGVNVIRTGGASGRQYVLLFSFDLPANLRKWEDSEERARWLERATELVEGSPHVDALTGLETWFTLPDEPPRPAPPRYKMTIVTELAIFPLLAALSLVLDPYLAPLPVLARVLVTSIVVVVMMTYVVMPRMARIFRRWLYG